MKRKLPILAMIAALILGAAACGTVGKHYGPEEEEEDPSSTPAEKASVPSYQTLPVLVDSIPSGAMIRLNGIRIGAGRATARVRVDDTGVLVTDTTISADYSTFVLAGNSTEIVTATYLAGDAPPKRLILARTADGGIQASGFALPDK